MLALALTTPKIFGNKTITIIIDLCLRKTGAGKPRD